MGSRLACESEATPVDLKTPINASNSKAHPSNNILFVQVANGIESGFGLSLSAHRNV